MFIVFDHLGDDKGHYKTLRGAIAKARKRSAALEGARHAVVGSEGEIVFETRDGIEMDAAALQAQAAEDFERHLAKTRT